MSGFGNSIQYGVTEFGSPTHQQQDEIDDIPIVITPGPIVSPVSSNQLPIVSVNSNSQIPVIIIPD